MRGAAGAAAQRKRRVNDLQEMSICSHAEDAGECQRKAVARGCSFVICWGYKGLYWCIRDLLVELGLLLIQSDHD